MGVNKVTINKDTGEEVLIDLTEDSVTPETLAKGTTAHGANGEPIVGVAPTEAVLYTEMNLNDEEKEIARNNIGAQPSGNYALKDEIPSIPVQSVNGKTGKVQLSASDVGARPSSWMPTAQEVGALPSNYTPPNQTAEQVGADPKGTASTAVSQHNTAENSHNDIRLELKAINDRLTAFFDSDNQTLDELSEIVAYITSNKSLIDSITTSKVSVADIVNNLTTNVSNKPMSAAQGVVLKGLIDTVSNNLANYQPKGDYALRSELPAVPTKVSAFTNDAGYLTKHQDISGKLDTSKLPTAIKDTLAYVTPQMYGAVGDGVTDDTNAFKRALAENDNVFVPDGNYLITEGLDITYKKGLFSNDGQRATIHFNGNGSVINLGRLSVFRNINIRIKNTFVGSVFRTYNHNVDSGQSALESRVGNVNVFFEVASPDATLIDITVDSGTDPNDIPRLKGVCYQTYQNIQVEYGCRSYGYGIKMELIQGRTFTEDANTGYPWITHIVYDNVFLGSPHTAIKAGVTVADGVEHYERIDMGHIMFNNVSTQYRDAESTQIFFDLDHFGGFFTKCIGWDYHPLTWAGNKVNIIGEDVTVCMSDCQMAFGADFLNCCEFTAETEYNVTDNPEYFINKYFPGTVLSQGYDGVDAKIDAKLSGAYIAGVAEEKVNEILYSGYSNILEDPLTQIKVGLRWSSSSQTWTEGYEGATKKTTVIIPIVKGGNIIRWTPSTYTSNGAYDTMYFFNNDDLSDGISVGKQFLLSLEIEENTGRVQIDNPSGYKYVALPFGYYTDISPETMTMTINREITENQGQSFTEYLNESVITPAVNSRVTEEVNKLVIPTKVSQLENDKGYLTEHQDLSEYAKASEIPTKPEDIGAQPSGNYALKTEIPTVPRKTSELINDSGFITADDIPAAQVPDLSGYALKSDAETWTFTLADGSTVTKRVVLA